AVLSVPSVALAATPERLLQRQPHYAKEGINASSSRPLQRSVSCPDARRGTLAYCASIDMADRGPRLARWFAVCQHERQRVLGQAREPGRGSGLGYPALAAVRHSLFRRWKVAGSVRP